ncbi:MAG: hypothetical protein R2851_15415 [Caldilineaceae bacterium]
MWRLYDARGKATADLLTLLTHGRPSAERLPVSPLRHPMDHTKYRIVRTSPRWSNSTWTVTDGAVVYTPPPLDELRSGAAADLARLDPGVRRLVNPHIYHVSLSQKLWGF